jgi:nucleotide sugar dehydrogenase
VSKATFWKDSDLETGEKRSKITVLVAGCGRTGLFTACLLAESGFKTLIVDSDHIVANFVKKGKSAFSDHKFTKLIKKHLKSSSLTITNNVKEASSKSAVIIIANSPLVDEKKRPDYAHMEKTSKEIGAGLQSGSLVLVEGIVGPGITEALVKESLQKTSGLKAGTDFSLAISPSSTTYEALRNPASLPRIIGASDEHSLRVACHFLKSISKSQIIPVKSIKTAEAIGTFKSVHEDVNHALSLELASFCEEAGIDFTECQKVMGAHSSSSLPVSNVARRYFSPEPYLIFEEAENSGSLLRLVMQSRKINEEMLKRTVHMTREALKSCGKAFRRARITVLGVSERADPEVFNYYFSRSLVSWLTKNGARVRVYDPLFLVKELVELGFQAEATLGKSIEGADCLLIAVGHERFRRLNLKRIRFLMKQPAALVDVCNVVDPERAVKEGFVYRGLGRG